MDKRKSITIGRGYTKVFFGKIYRFMDMNGIVESLKSSTLRYSSTLKFNDPLDCSFHTFNFEENAKDLFTRNKTEFKKQFASAMYESFKNIFGDDVVLDDLIAEKKSNDFKEDELSKIINDDQAESIFIKLLAGNPTILYDPKSIKFCCFSKDYSSPQSALMWAHYADKHKGACLEFDFYRMAKELRDRSSFKVFRNRFINGVEIKFRPFVVSYVDKIPKYKFEQTRKDFRWLCTKSKIWRYEMEVRCILLGSVDDSLTEDIPFPFEYLSKVIFGKFSSVEEIANVKAIINEKYPNNKVLFEQMDINDSLALYPESLAKIEKTHKDLQEKIKNTSLKHFINLPHIED
jgi:hypothetical protein